jgi:hypothetical protein
LNEIKANYFSNWLGDKGERDFRKIFKESLS